MIRDNNVDVDNVYSDIEICAYECRICTQWGKILVAVYICSQNSSDQSRLGGLWLHADKQFV